MRRLRSILLFLGVISAAGLSLPAAGASRGGAPTLTGRLAGSVVADLDGDRQADVAISRATRRGGSSYLHDITFHFSGSEDRVITVRTVLKAERMTLRDLDGDADCDLVLESITREPLAVFLNDGNGHFHEGHLEDLHFQLERPEFAVPRSGGYDFGLRRAWRIPEPPDGGNRPFDGPAASLLRPPSVRHPDGAPDHTGFRRPFPRPSDLLLNLDR